MPMPDLSFATAAMEGLMGDVCRINSAGLGRADDAFDVATGLWADEPQGALLYGPGLAPWNGKCSVKDATLNRAAEEAEGDAVVVNARWLAKIPLGAPVPPRGSMLTVVTSRDHAAVGKRFRIADYGGGTMRVSRLLILEERAPTIREGDI